MTSGSRETRERLRAIRNLRHHATGEELPVARSDINVTPLVDVVLVLLIIFMVVTPMIASGVAVDLPRTENHSRKPDDGKDIIVSMTRDERVYVGGNRVRVEELGQAVQAEQRKSPDKGVFLKADSRAPFGIVRKSLDALQSANIQDVYLGTEELHRNQDQE